MEGACQFPVLGLRKGRKGLYFLLGFEGGGKDVEIEASVGFTVWGAFGSEEEVVEAISIAGGGCEVVAVEAPAAALSCDGG